ncbi:triose-phosphate isomerase [Sphingosinithalassobacter sp. LHW66-3]|uniref:triose-phosphate isomerase n=1 Tax=Sphingosinithalassobacter sp. LHW66-3 TaxID=3424718 RepID=UPI003D6B6FC4
MRRKFVAGNWKMNGTRAQLGEVRAIAEAAAKLPQIDAALCVPFTLIASAADAAGAMPIGAQDVHEAEKGAHTGCVSAAMLVEAGAKLAIVGHSERRADQNETGHAIWAKAAAAHKQGLGVILCVGETEFERDAGRAERVVQAQIEESLPEDADGSWLTLAYEPRWAIGTGRTPTPEEIEAIHAAIRRKLTDLIGDRADGVRILYGGSMNGANAAAILAVENVDGGLIGGASLTAEKFVPILEAAAASSR